MKKPLDFIKLIGDKLIRDTPFKYKMEVAPATQSLKNSTVEGLQFIDFGRTFGLGRAALAYAYTLLTAPKDMETTLEIEHNDSCKVWLNGKIVYEKLGDQKLNLIFDERSVVMSGSFKAKLKKGQNTLLIKSETKGDEWTVYLQLPSLKFAIVAQDDAVPEIGIKGIEHLDTKVAALSNWLVVGPFANPVSGGRRMGMETVYAPEKEFCFGYMYEGINGLVTWTIPKIEILGAMIDPLPWGTNYQWNYHNGGVAWSMQYLAEVCGEKKYDDYAAHFCDYHLEGIPFVKHQVKTLNALLSANHFIIDTPLLDFTLAPALPFIYRLRKQKAIPNVELYKNYVDNIIHYARYEQVRLPGHNIYTRTTPVKYTTWVDDMFMGIPFLVQAALYAKDEETKKVFLEDAVHQTLEFNTQVWDADANLYMHARFFGNKAKLPHWSRCNGWAVWAMSEVLTNLPKEHPKYNAILTHFRKHIDSLIKFQDSSGFWFNVLERKDSPKEVSGTAIFTMGIARGVKNGWLQGEHYKKAAIKGWEALETQIDPDGTVHSICYGTMCCEDEEYYVNRPLYDNDTHGLFAVIFAGIDVHNMLK